MWWIKGFKPIPQKIFIVHGEAAAAEEICRKIKEELKVEAHLPELGETLIMEGEKIIVSERIRAVQRDREIEALEENIEKLKLTLWELLPKLEEETDKERGADSERINRLQNKLIELQKTLLELNMLLLEGAKEEG